MRRLLFVVSLLFVLAAAAAAQERSVEYRLGDAFHGPVKSARIEFATFARVDGRLVEGPRRLMALSTYTPDGKRKEHEQYLPDGSLRDRYVYLYDDAGNEVETTVFDGAGKLRLKKVYRPDSGETLTYGPDEKLRERRVIIRRGDGTLAETQVYDGDGVLKERSVNEREGKTSYWRTYGPDGTLRRQDTYSLDYGGPHHSESQTYAAGGSVVGRRGSGAHARKSDPP